MSASRIAGHPMSAARAMVRAARPYQWVKNILVFAPLLAAGDFTNGSAWLAAFGSFAAFCAVASAMYLLNDISDLAADRLHPRKRHRPIASGALSIASALAMTPILLALGFYLGWMSDILLALALYGGLAISYNFWIKEIAVVDVFVLAALYTVRLFGGGEATDHPVSLWLLGFSSFLFLSLALIKRASELYRLSLEHREFAARRGYVTADLGMLQMMGCAATFASAVVLSLYIQSDTAFESYAQPNLLWGIIPLILFWQCRLWLFASRGYVHDDPIVYAAHDLVSWLTFAGVGIVTLAARFLLGA